MEISRERDQGKPSWNSDDKDAQPWQPYEQKQYAYIERQTATIVDTANGSRRQYNIGSSSMYMIRKATNTGVAGATLSRTVNSDYVLSPVDILIGILQSDAGIDIPTRHTNTIRIMKTFYTDAEKFEITELRGVLRIEFS